MIQARVIAEVLLGHAVNDVQAVVHYWHQGWGHDVVGLPATLVSKRHELQHQDERWNQQCQQQSYFERTEAIEAAHTES